MSNVINAVFGATKKTKTDPIFQYDYGNKLQFVGVELPSSYEVHFSNYNYGESKVMIGDSTGVEIPYEYTKNYGRVFAWVFIHESEDVGWTKYLAEIPVIQRAKPSYDPVDPYEQSIVEQLVSTVEGLQDDVSGAKEDVQTLQKKKADVIVSSASGSVAAFADGADDMPVESLKCFIEPVQSGSGTPSPTNVRPISGHTQVVVTRTGVNVWDEEWEYGVYNIYSANGNGAKEGASQNYTRCKNLIRIAPNTEYYLRKVDTAGDGRIGFYDRNRVYLGYDNSEGIGVTGTSAITFTTPDNAYYMSIYKRNALSGSSINYPSTDHDYHAYTGQSISVTFPTSAGTVYGGYVDVVKGELVVDLKEIDLSDYTWELKSEYNNLWISTRGIADADDTVPLLLCENVPYQRLNLAETTQGSNINRSYNIWIRNGSTTQQPSGKALYKLATPITYTLTKQQLNTLLGNNSIYCDTGNTEVSYPADTKLYIDGKIAELQALVLEN